MNDNDTCPTCDAASSTLTVGTSHSLAKGTGAKPSSRTARRPRNWFAERERDDRCAVSLFPDRPSGQFRCLDLGDIHGIGQLKLKGVRGAGVHIQIEGDLPAKSGRFDVADRAAVDKDQGRPVAARETIGYHQRHQARAIDGNAERLPTVLGALGWQRRLADLQLLAFVKPNQDLRCRHRGQFERGCQVPTLACQRGGHLQFQFEPAFLLQHQKQGAVVLAAKPGRLTAQLRRLDGQSAEGQVDRLPVAAQFRDLDAAGHAQFVIVELRFVRGLRQHRIGRRDRLGLDVALGFLPQSQDLVARHQHAFGRTAKQHLQLIRRDVHVTNSRWTVGDLSRRQGKETGTARRMQATDTRRPLGARHSVRLEAARHLSIAAPPWFACRGLRLSGDRSIVCDLAAR